MDVSEVYTWDTGHEHNRSSETEPVSEKQQQPVYRAFQMTQ